MNPGWQTNYHFSLTTQSIPNSEIMLRDIINYTIISEDIRLRVWIHDARRRMDTISDITDKIKETFDAQGLEIPYPKRDIIITQKQN